MNALSRLIEWATLQSEKPYLIECDETLRYGDLLRRAMGIREVLLRERIRPGSKVVILAESYRDQIPALLGCWLHEVIAVPINLGLPLAVQRRLIEISEPALLFAEQGVPCPYGDAPVHSTDTANFIESTEPLLTIPRKGEALTLFTSGTTGASKGAQLTLQALSDNARYAAESFQMRDDDVLMVNTPPYFTSGLSHALATLMQGSTLVSELGFQMGDRLNEVMAKYKCTGFGGAPTHFIQFFESVQKLPSFLRFWVSSGDHLTKEWISRTLNRFPELKIFSAYGLTEVAGRFCVLDPKHLPKKAGSVGQPMGPMSLRIEGASAPFDEGEVVVKGPFLMAGYLGEKPLGKYGEFRTGDVGYLDEEGFLWLKGREDDLFKSGGEKVSVVAIQNQIRLHPKVNDVAVVPEGDLLLGQIPHAYVVLKEGVELASVRRELRKSLRPVEFPKRFTVVESIPRTGSGKVQMRELENLEEVA